LEAQRELLPLRL